MPPAAAEPLKSEYRLSEAEKERIFAEAAARAQTQGEREREGRVQAGGSFGFGLGTDGYRSAYGTGFISFDGGGATLSGDVERTLVPNVRSSAQAR